MTVSSETNRWDFTGNGVLTTYPFTAEIYVKTDLKVYVSGVLKTVDVDYTIAAASIENPAGGNVEFTTAPALSAPVAIVLNLPLTQLVDYREGDAFPAETHERALDRLVKLMQYLKQKFMHVAKLGDDSAIELVMPNPVADNYIGWNAAATNLENKTNPVALTTATQWEVDALVTYGGGTAYTKATIDTALTAIGTVNKTTLLLRPGNWTITANADYSTYKNVTFKTPNGAYFTLTALMTLTLPSPENIEAAPNQQIFAGTGTVAFSRGGTVYPEWWGAIADDSTACTDAINAALESQATGGIVQLQEGTYRITTVTMNNNGMTLQGTGWTSILKTSKSKVALTAPTVWVDADNCILRDFKLTWVVMPVALYAGNDPVTDENMIAVGHDGPTETLHVNTLIDHVYVLGAHKHAIAVGYTTDVTVRNCRVDYCYATGIVSFYGTGLKITGNYLYYNTDTAIDIGAYAATTPGRGVIISNNVIYDCGVGIGAHGGDDVVIIGNTIDLTWEQGISVTDDGSVNVDPYNCVISNNIIRRPWQNFGGGAFHAADYAATGATGVIEILTTTGNIVISDNIIYEDHTCLSTIANHSAIKGIAPYLTISGNTIYTKGTATQFWLSPYAAATGYTDILQLSVTGNTVYVDAAVGTAMFYLDGISSGTITGNVCYCNGLAPNGYAVFPVKYVKNLLVQANYFEGNLLGTYILGANIANLLVINNIGVWDYISNTSTTAALAAVANAINTTGKYVGKVVWNLTTGKMVRAFGSAAADVWLDEGGQTAHTPI